MPSSLSSLPSLPRELPVGRRAALLFVVALAAVAVLLWAWWPAGVLLGVAVAVLAVLAIGQRLEQDAAGPVDEELSARLGIASPDPADPDLLRAVGLVVGSQYASAARLQRDLHVPYTRARSLLADLEREHVVGPPSGTAPRRVLVPRERLAEVQRRIAR